MALAPQAAGQMVREVGLRYRRGGGQGSGGPARASGQDGSASRWADLGCLVVIGRTASGPEAGRESDPCGQPLNLSALAPWKLFDGLAHRRPGSFDLLDGPLARCPPASLLLIEHGVDGIGESVRARAEVVRVP